MYKMQGHFKMWARNSRLLNASTNWNRNESGIWNIYNIYLESFINVLCLFTNWSCDSIILKSCSIQELWICMKQYTHCFLALSISFRYKKIVTLLARINHKWYRSFFFLLVHWFPLSCIWIASHLWWSFIHLTSSHIY